MYERSTFWAKSFDRYAGLIRHAGVIQKIVYPSLIRKVGLRGPVLDFGGGSGLFFDLLPDQLEASLYDPVAEAVLEAQRRCSSDRSMRRRFFSSANALPSRYFGTVVMCFVLMSIPTQVEEQSVLERIQKTILPGGKLVAVVTHPCFRSHHFSCFETDFSRGRPFEYALVDTPFEVFLLGRDREDELSLPNFHRPLAITINAILKAGFFMDSIEELFDYDEQRWFNRLVPPYLLIEATAGDGG
jgi:hypothetical protein